jgi:hypothetical protein
MLFAGLAITLTRLTWFDKTSWRRAGCTARTGGRAPSRCRRRGRSAEPAPTANINVAAAGTVHVQQPHAQGQQRTSCIHPILQWLEVKGCVVRVPGQVAGWRVRKWRGGCCRVCHHREDRCGDHHHRCCPAAAPPAALLRAALLRCMRACAPRAAAAPASPRPPAAAVRWIMEPRELLRSDPYSIVHRATHDESE